MMRRKIIGYCIFVAAAVLLLPGGLILLLGPDGTGHKLVMDESLGTQADDITLQVYLVKEDTVKSMQLEEYLCGVMSAEMPAEFSPEALKAQAVAARTYAVRNMRAFGGTGIRNGKADISTDYREGQAWLSDDECRERWGRKYSFYRRKIRQAVEATYGELLCYDKHPIAAVFHSSSGGKTASAAEVWGSDVPYLQSVECPWDETAPHASDSLSITAGDIAAVFGDNAAIVPVSTADSTMAEIIERTESGRVGKLRIGSQTFSGQEIRQLAGLRSSLFSIECTDSGLTFYTHGNGHGVGMSQYGAEGMAKQGRSYQEILAYFYQNTEIKQLKELSL